MPTARGRFAGAALNVGLERRDTAFERIDLIALRHAREGRESGAEKEESSKRRARLHAGIRDRER